MLSLLIPYRNRPSHLKALFSWASQKEIINDPTFEIILIEQDSTPSARKICEAHNVKYIFRDDAGPFHKTHLLNMGLNNAKREYVTPFDIDLIPYSDSLQRHLRMAIKYNPAVITGYRLMCPQNELNYPLREKELFNTSSVAPEDLPTAVYKQLAHKEKFGVLPIFLKSRLLSIKAWDEKFIGWGGEDQDVLERYLGDSDFLRCPEIIYFHLNHNNDPHWKDESLIHKNRAHYYSKRKPI